LTVALCTSVDLLPLALRQTLAEITGILDGSIETSDLKAAQAKLCGTHLQSMTGVANTADRLSYLESYRLADQHFHESLESLMSCGTQDVQDVAWRFLSPERAVIVVAGPALRLQSLLGDAGWDIAVANTDELPPRN
jgi:predicted Zn-dependent peptidase